MTTTYSFTKLVVDDLEKMSAFYTEVYGLKQYDRMQASVGEEPIDEVMLGTTDANTGGVILLKFLDRKPAERGEIILAIPNTR